MPKPRQPHAIIGGIEHKRCFRCERWRRLSAYSTDRRSWDGLFYCCGECYRAGKPVQDGHLARRESVRSEALAAGAKACKVCGEMKPLSGFIVNRRYSDGFSRVCRSCVNEEKRRARGATSARV